MRKASIPPAERRHLLTVALEDYFQTGPFRKLIDRNTWYRFETRLEVGTLRALDLLDQFGARATFFVLGWVADVAPELIRTVRERGHEIASKGYYHRTIRQVSREEFRDDLVRSREAIERAGRQQIAGYRVPDRWLGPADLWALDVLAENGFQYDSSLRPMLRAYADEPWRRVVHRHHCRDGKTLWEFPLSSTDVLGLQVPVAGGNYFRQFPQWAVRRAVARWDRTVSAPFVMYFHTWELDPAQPRFAAPLRSRIRQYRNLDRMPAIMAYYLDRYSFTSIADYLGLDLKPPRYAAATGALAASVAIGGARTRPDGTPPRSITLIVPCYNEETALPYLANTLRSVSLTLAPEYSLQVILVDDGSVDGTWSAMTELFAAEPNVRCQRHGANLGVAAAIMTGIRSAETDIVCSIDCDCTYDPHEFAEMIPLLSDGVDVVTASPYHPLGRVKNVAQWRLCLSRTASWLYNMLLGHRLFTYTSCFRVYRRSAVTGLEVRSVGFIGVAEMLVRLELAGGRIVEYPTTLDARLLGRSKMRVLRTIAGHLALMGQLLILRLGGPQVARAPQETAPRQLPRDSVER